QLSAGPPPPGPVHRRGLRAAQQLKAAERLGQRRDREPGRGQVGHAQLKYQLHVLTVPRLCWSRRGFSPALKPSSLRPPPPTLATMSKLGRPYWRMWWANAISGTGDGAFTAALPLLAVAITRDPRLVSVVTAAMFLPWMVLSLPGGAIVDRYDRATLMWRSQAVQAAVVTAVAIAIASGQDSIAILSVAGLLLGCAEVIFSNAAQAVLPALVPPELLPRANGSQQVSLTIGESFLGPPVGSLLFAAAAALPFGLDAVSFAGSAALVATLPRSPRSREKHPPIRAQIAEGLRWLARHRLLRVVAVLLGVY